MSNNKPLVLVTGAGGRIGRAFVSRNAGRFRFRIADLNGASMDPIRDHAEGDPLVFDVSDRDACAAACGGVDAVVHLAGYVDPGADFHRDLLGPNVVGVFNVFEAAAAAGVKRLVYASSAQTIEGYPKDLQPDVTHPVRPDNLYGVCKVFGEALARHLYDKQGLSAVCVRIANFREELTARTNMNMRDMTAYISPRDLSELLARAVEVEGVGFAIVNGVSGNRYKRMRMDETCELLGFELEDDAFAVKGYPEPAAKSDPAF